MRPFEILTSVLALLLAAIILLAPRRSVTLLLNCVLLITSLSIQLAYEGAHWQLIPLYLACLVLLALSMFAGRLLRWVGVVSGVASALLVLCTVVLSWMLPMFRLPKPTGPYTVGTRILHLVDLNRTEENGPSPSGKRELMVQVWYPADPKAAMSSRLAVYQRRKELTLRASYRSVLKTHSYLDATVGAGVAYPVLIYNPSWMGERTEGSFQMEELASHGFVVIAVDHTFMGGLIEFPDGRVMDSHTAPMLGSFANTTVAEEWAVGGKYVRIEAQDDIFVLDQFEKMNRDSQSPWFGKLDMSRVGAFGFSLGGATAIQMAYQDPRVKAALNLDGWSFGDVSEHAVAKPLMVIYEDKTGVLPVAAEHSPVEYQRRVWQFSAEDFAHVTRNMHESGGYLVFIAGAHHVNFTDRSLLSPIPSWTGRGPVDPVRAHANINAYTLAFFSRFLNGTNEPLLDGEAAAGKLDGVEFQRFEGTAISGQVKSK